MFSTVFTRDAACLMLRLGLGVIFLVHGSEKVSHDWGTSWEPEFGTITNAILAWGELVGGAAMLVGLFTRVTAVCFSFVMVCALYMVGSLQGFQGNPNLVIKGFDYMRVGAEFPFALLLQCFAVLLLGGGAFSVDHCLRRYRTSQSATAAPAIAPPHINVLGAPAETRPH
jgi:putative oxidoreductase